MDEGNIILENEKHIQNFVVKNVFNKCNVPKNFN